MGYGMAVNLRSKLDKNTTFYICDISEKAINRFRSELEGHGPIEVVENGAAAAQAAVSQFSVDSRVTINLRSVDRT
jgi:hypothetical protein